MIILLYVVIQHAKLTSNLAKRNETASVI
jgi:hypothetical protein